MRPAAKDKVALERLGTAARRRGTTPPPTSRCRPPHPCAHRDSGEGAVEGCTGNAPGQVKQEVKEHGRDDAPDEHARIRVPPHIDRFPSRRLRWDHLKTLPQVAPDKEIAPAHAAALPLPRKSRYGWEPFTNSSASSARGPSGCSPGQEGAQAGNPALPTAQLVPNAGGFGRPRRAGGGGANLGHRAVVRLRCL